jgi:hypothetical protein
MGIREGGGGGEEEEGGGGGGGGDVWKRISTMFQKEELEKEGEGGIMGAP